MNTRLSDILYEFDTADVDKLIDFKIEPRINGKIKKRILSKLIAGKNRGSHKHAAVRIKLTAALAIVLALAVAFNFSLVSAAVGKLFSLLPGDRIEKNSPVKYTLASQVTSQTGNSKMTLLSCEAAETYMDVIFKVDVEKVANSENGQKNSEDTAKSSIRLYVDGKEYTPSNDSIGGGNEIIASAAFNLSSDDIQSENQYTLEYGSLSLTFSLKEADRFRSLEDIGPTVTKNDISLTAVPIIEDGRLKVQLYAVNKSGYTIKPDYGFKSSYLSKQVTLQTDQVEKTMLDTQESYDNSLLQFDISDHPNQYTLKIPFILVTGHENHNAALPIPKNNEKKTVNKEIRFQDSVMKIVSVQKVDNAPEQQLKVELAFENKKADKTLTNAAFDRTGKNGNFSYRSDFDENNILKTVWIDLEDNDLKNGKINVSVSEPEYILEDEYDIELK